MSASDLAVDALGEHHPRAAGDVRIVSLVPSLTELLFALDLGDSVVGRTGFCVHPQPAIRRVRKVGGTKDVDIERVQALAPTHLIVNIDENRRETVEDLRNCVPHIIVTHPLGPDDNLGLYRLFGTIFGRGAQAEMLAGQYRASKEALLQAARGWSRRNVLYLIWRKPWMTVSRPTYISAMLALAGWDTVPANAAQRYPEASGDDRRACDLLLLSTEPYRFRARDAAQLAASQRAPVALIDGEMISWYGSRAIAGLRYLRDFRTRIEEGR